MASNTTSKRLFLTCLGDPPKTVTPLSVYVLWHPQFTVGAMLAREIYEWFGQTTSDARSVGIGIPVHFRSADWNDELALTEAEEITIPLVERAPGVDALDARRRNRLSARRRPVQSNQAKHNVFVPLVDDYMMEDPSWRRDLIEIGIAAGDAAATDRKSSDTHVHLLPVQVSSAWTRLPTAVTEHQAIFLSSWKDPESESDEARVTRWKTRLRRLITQALVRTLREHSGSLLPTEVFLSHAKRDGEFGPGVAEALRDAAAGYGQIEVFYDENDLPAGQNWSHRLLGSASAGAGFVAVLSDHYATRYWCRREIETARTPEPVAKLERATEGALANTESVDNAGTDPIADPHVWAVRPTVAAIAFAGSWTRFVSELATAPVVAWETAKANEILDRLFQEALVSEFQLMYARQLLHRLVDAMKKLKVDTEDPPIALITWTPDPASILRLHQKLITRGRDDDETSWTDPVRRRWLVAYPGHGFLPTEELTLHRFFGDEVAFVSYERLIDALVTLERAIDKGAKVPETWHDIRDFLTGDLNARALGQRQPKRPFDKLPRLALSAGDASELAALGFDSSPGEAPQGSLHVDAAMIRILRASLEAGARISFGGTIRDSGSFTALLQDAVASVFPEGAKTEDPDPWEASDPATPFDNYLAWPHGLRVSHSARADYVGLARYHDIDPPSDGVPELDPERLARGREAFPPGEGAWLNARALSRMRWLVACRTEATFAIAGRSTAFTGFMPGVAEEVLCATEAGAGAACPLALDASCKPAPLTIRPDNVRVILVGAFGGPARMIARYLLRPSATLHECLTCKAQSELKENVQLQLSLSYCESQASEGTMRAWIEWRYARLGEALAGLRAVAQLDDDVKLTRLGISVGQWKRLMTTESPGLIRRILKDDVVPGLPPPP